MSPQRDLVCQSSKANLNCFWCKKKLQIDDNKILAIKCTCYPPMYFCSKLCHRSHWVDPISGQCKMYTFMRLDQNGVKFTDLDSPITWKESEYVHPVKDFENTLQFPVTISQVMKYLKELQAFKLDINASELLLSVSNLNITSNYTVAIIPKSRYIFEFLFIDKVNFSFSEYNTFLQMCETYFRSENIPELLTLKLMEYQNLKL